MAKFASFARMVNRHRARETNAPELRAPIQPSRPSRERPMSRIPRSDDDIHRASIEWLTSEIVAGDQVVDIGCGTGWMMRLLVDKGACVLGVEPTAALVAQARAVGLDVRQGRAESVPLPDACCTVIVCSVALPYMHPVRAACEWARLLRPGGRVVLTTHGVGYPLRHLRREGRAFKAWIYAARMAINTATFVVTGRLLPGRLGDTLFHTTGMLRRAYRAAGLELTSAEEWGSIFGRPSFLAHRLRRPFE
jgi:SAM-dependent methyltransferase